MSLPETAYVRRICAVCKKEHLDIFTNYILLLKQRIARNDRPQPDLCWNCREVFRLNPLPYEKYDIDPRVELTRCNDYRYSHTRWSVMPAAHQENND